jgi:hypothetical protein
MINIIVKNIILFIVIILIQVLVLNNIQLSGFINPYIYILFIMMLPFETPGWLVLVLSFVIGLSIDSFSNTMGMHASASIFVGFIRHYLLKLLAPREGYESGTEPRIKYYGINWFLRYTIAMVVLHHTFLFYTEVFRFSDFFITFFRVFVSSLFSIGLIIVSQFVMYKNN